jgi:hypothetical protein
MIEVLPPDFYNQKEVENYFIKLITYSSTPYEAFKEFCKHESSTDIREMARDIINSEYVQIKRRYGSSLVKELL